MVHVVFIFIQILKEHLMKANRGDPDRTRRSVASGHDLHFLSMSSKKALGLNRLKHSRVTAEPYITGSQASRI